MKRYHDPYTDPVILQIHDRAMAEQNIRLMRRCLYLREIGVQCRCWSIYNGCKENQKPMVNCLYECTPTPIKFGQQKLCGDNVKVRTKKIRA